MDSVMGTSSGVMFPGMVNSSGSGGLFLHGFNISSSSGQVHPLPAFPKKVDNLKLFYEIWDTEWRAMMSTHYDNHRRYKWSAQFGKKSGKVTGKRWHVCKDFLFFVDSVPQKERPSVFSVMENFCTANGVCPNILVKKVFYFMANPELVVEKEYEGLPSKLWVALYMDGFEVQGKQNSKKQRVV